MRRCSFLGDDWELLKAVKTAKSYCSLGRKIRNQLNCEKYTAMGTQMLTGEGVAELLQTHHSARGRFSSTMYQGTFSHQPVPWLVAVPAWLTRSACRTSLLREEERRLPLRYSFLSLPRPFMQATGLSVAEAASPCQPCVTGSWSLSQIDF